MNNSVDRALRIVELLNQLGRPTALKDVAKAANLNKATAYRLLRSLCDRGLVQNVGDSGSYALGPACLTFAEGFRKSFTMRDRVLPFLEKLVMVTGETESTANDMGSIPALPWNDGTVPTIPEHFPEPELSDR